MSNTSEQTLLFVPAGKLRCYIHTDVLREDTPEEHVRQRVARSLVEEYGYDRRDLHLEFPITIGSGKKKRVDIAIFPPGADHKQELLYIIVEAKREDIRPNDREQGVDQLKSYMAACLRARWGLWVGSEMIALEKEQDADKAAKVPFQPSTDIPLRGDNEPKRLEFADLVPATGGLRHVFARCHDYLHVNGNLGKEKAFFELLKLIFCKLYDEQHTNGTLDFSVSIDERRSELGQRKLKQRVAGLFDKVRDEYPYIFPHKNEAIELDLRSLAYTVAELQKYSLIQTESDIKGEAYEEIVSVTSRRDHGAFFTPRNVCDLAVEMVLSTYHPDQRLKLRILDPCCGTGGFLRAALLHIKRLIAEAQSRKWKSNASRADDETTKLLREYCNKQIFGIDKLPELVRAAQMNMALHGDGSTNVFWENSLVMPGEWKPDTHKHVDLASFDVVFTNPPFGSKLPVDDPHILDRYDLAKYEAKAPRASLPPEQLFVQRCLELLKPGGRMAIVLPDSILSNPGLAWLRRWVLREAWIIASIDLPREMFARSDTHTMTSVLILQRFTGEERREVQKHGHPPDYDIFMALAEKVGWDLRGQPVYMRTPEGEAIKRKVKKAVSHRNASGVLVEEEVEVEEDIIHDQMPEITSLFKQWLKSNAPHKWQH